MNVIRYKYNPCNLFDEGIGITNYQKILKLEIPNFLQVVKWEYAGEEFVITYNFNHKISYPQLKNYNLRFKLCCLLSIVVLTKKDSSILCMDFTANNICFDYLGNCYLITRNLSSQVVSCGEKIKQITWIFSDLISKTASKSAGISNRVVPNEYQRVLRFTTIIQWENYLNNLIFQNDNRGIKSKKSKDYNR